MEHSLTFALCHTCGKSLGGLLDPVFAAALTYQAGCSSELHEPLLLVAEMIHESKHELFCILSSLFLCDCWT